MKTLLTSLCLLCLALTTRATECDDLAAAIRAGLPSREWKIQIDAESISITGPKGQFLSRESLPHLAEEQLWREFAVTERVQIKIHFQARVSDSDLKELEQLTVKFRNIKDRANAGINHRGKDGDIHVREYGYIRLPDFRSAQSSIFITQNVANRDVRPASVSTVIKDIYQVIAKKCAEPNTTRSDVSEAKP